MFGTQCDSSSASLLSKRRGESLTPLEWVSMASDVPQTAEEMQFAASSSRFFSRPNTAHSGDREPGSFYWSEEDPGCPRDEEEVQAGRAPATRNEAAVPVAPPMRSPGLRESPELGASAPTDIPRVGGPEACQPECNNPSAHRCGACREKEMKEEFHKHVPGYLAAENGSKEVPCCSLSSALHTIVHVCNCMTPFELDRALAIENLRLERVRDAHAVVLTIAKKYGIESVFEDQDLMLIIYKYDEMMRMYAMMGASITPQRRQSYLRRVTASLIPESPAGRKKKSQKEVSAEAAIHCDPALTQEVHQDPARATPGFTELDERLREATRQHFGLQSMGTLTTTHVPPADGSWRLAIHEPNGLKIFFRRHASSTLISFRVEGTVDANLLNIVSVLNEMDLYKQWIPYYTFPVKLGLREVTRLYQFGRVEQIDLLQLDFPWPMNNRDCCVEIWAVDDLDYTNRFFIRITSLDGGNANPRLPVTVPMPPHKTLRLYCEGAMILVPLGRDKTFIELLWTLDPKVHLSDYIMNFFTKVFAKSAFQAFCKVCADASGGEHARRRENCPLLYGFVEKRLVEIEKAHEHRDGNISTSFLDQLPGGSSRVAAPMSPKQVSMQVQSSDPTEHASSPERERDEIDEALHAKKSRSGKIGFSFRRRRSSLMSEAAKP